MNDHQMRDAYDASLRAQDDSTAGAPIPLERVAALVGREGNEADRLRTLDVLMSSAEGRREFEVAWAAARAAQRPARPWWRANGVAAAALLVVSVGSFAVLRNRDGHTIAASSAAPSTASSTAPGAEAPGGNSRGATSASGATRVTSPSSQEPPAAAPASAPTRETMRGAGRESDSPLQLVAPRGDAVPAQSVRFVWHHVDNARDYTLIVVDSTGTEVFASTTRDTAVTLPDSIRLRAGAQYLWWVQTDRADGTSVSAVTEKVRVRK
jgi:hypothetical protein